MGSWHQDLVVKNVTDKELDIVIELVIQFLINSKIISTRNVNYLLDTESGYFPGENWHFAVEHPDEDNFLKLANNGIEVRKGRTVFWANGSDFEKIECPICFENNLDCDWGKLFNQWIENPTSANLECKSCHQSISISEYNFEPKWHLSNLGFVFWNWPILKNSFIRELEKLIQKRIELVEGKL